MIWIGKHQLVGISAAAFSLALGTVFAPTDVRAEDDVLVMAATGGSYQNLMKEHIFDPFTEETGIKVVFVSGSIGERWAKIEAMTNAGNFEWDLMESGAGDVFNPARTKFLESLGENCAKVPKAYTDGLPTTCAEYGVLVGVGSTQLTVNTDAFGASYPTTWKDFWDVEAYPGPRALQNFGSPWRVLVGALTADGVSKEDLFPLDLDRAFAKLDEIKPQIQLWWNSGDQIQRAFREEEVTFGMIWGTRLAFLKQEGVPLKPLWDGATLNEAHWVVFKDGPHKDVALKFLNWLYDNPQAQYNFTVAGSISPATKSAVEFFKPEEQVDQPGHPDNVGGILPVDYKYLADNHEAILERWNTWLAN